jgi:hypothetical protein
MRCCIMYSCFIMVRTILGGGDIVDTHRSKENMRRVCNSERFLFAAGDKWGKGCPISTIENPSLLSKESDIGNPLPHLVEPLFNAITSNASVPPWQGASSFQFITNSENGYFAMPEINALNASPPLEMILCISQILIWQFTLIFCFKNDIVADLL